MENNYLSKWQEEAKAEELKNCKDSLCKSGIETKWALISSMQDISLQAGMKAGAAEVFVRSGLDIAIMSNNPAQFIMGLKQVFQKDNALGYISDAVAQEYINRFDNYLSEYEKAGVSGSFNAGRELGKTLADVAMLYAGGEGLVKGISTISKKLSSTVAKDVVKGSGSAAGKAEGAISDTSNINKGSDWKYVEGEYSQKPTDGMNVETSPNGKYDADGLPYKDTKPFVKQEYVDILSEEAKLHILYGDKPGSGGHLFPGQANKTTFPSNWPPEKIINDIGDIVTSPNTQWYAQTGTGGLYTSKGQPAKWVSYSVKDGVRIKVVYMPATGKVVTAYPDNAPLPNYKQIK